MVCGALQNIWHVQSTVHVPVSSWFDAWRRVDVLSGPNIPLQSLGRNSFYLQKEVCEAVEVVLPRRHFLIVRFEHAKVKKSQLHNMGEEAERSVGVVSLLSSFLSQPRKQSIGLYLEDTTHSICSIRSRNCWGKSAVTFYILLFGIPKMFCISSLF